MRGKEEDQMSDDIYTSMIRRSIVNGNTEVLERTGVRGRGKGECPSQQGHT
jgi:hypothetical protein